MHETILIDQKIRHPGNFHPLLDIVKTAMLHALPHNIVTWTPQYYTIGVAVLLGSDPGIYCGVWDTKPYHNYNIAGSVLCKKRMSTSREYKVSYWLLCAKDRLKLNSILFFMYSKGKAKFTQQIT